MGMGYSTSEFLEMAEEIERNGIAFYSEAADRFRDSPLGEVLDSLAEMERDHEKTFAHMRETLDGPDPALSPYDEEHEAVQYVQAIVQGKVFDPKGPQDVARIGTPEEILSTAIGAEKDSIVFYLGLRDLSSDEKSREALEAIIAEEMDHVRELSQVRATVLESEDGEA